MSIDLRVVPSLCKGRLRLPPVFTSLAPRLRHGASCAAVRRHRVIESGEDQARAATKPWVGDIAAGARPSLRAPHRAWFFTWRGNAPAGAHGCATAQPASERRGAPAGPAPD